MPVILAAVCGCGSPSGSKAGEAAGEQAPAAVAAEAKVAGVFSADSAMEYLRRQVEAGPRVPGSSAHRATGEYLASELRRLGADTVIEQHVEVTAWNGDRLPLRNIMARYAPQSNGRRVLLVAHWDSRPWADAETDKEKASHPIDGANDGASGVAVLMEIARLMSLERPDEPVDILLVDGEDYGAPDGQDGDGTSWCLGTQAWLKSGQPYDFATLPRYAVLLDMVGGRDARFHREAVSDYMARDVTDKVWRRAAQLGMADRFVNAPGGTVVDDHLFLNRAGIPAIDIIESNHEATGSFNPTWHTHDDTIDNIDPHTLEAVGQLIQSIVYDRKL